MFVCVICRIFILANVPAYFWFHAELYIHVISLGFRSSWCISLDLFVVMAEVAMVVHTVLSSLLWLK